MLTVKAKIPPSANYSLVLPLAIPDLSEVKAFALHLHASGKPWQGELFGWPAAYTPESRRRPVGSHMRFTPADFWIGESGIWFFSLMWEHGKAQEPVEFLDDRGIIKPSLELHRATMPALDRALPLDDDLALALATKQQDATMDTPIIDKVVERLRDLPQALQWRVLECARALAVSTPRGVSGQHLLGLAGGISPEDAQLMREAIEQGCEQVDAPSCAHEVVT